MMTTKIKKTIKNKEKKMRNYEILNKILNLYINKLELIK